MNEINQPVTDLNTFAGLCKRLTGEKYLAVDTEFTRTKTYFPKLELIQISSVNLMFCVDVPCISDWSSLREVVKSSATTTVLHSADQDLEVLAQYDLLPSRILDSQIAAQLCGAQKLSYKNIVEEYLGIELTKDQTRSNWSIRPLSSPQIQYALNDVRYVLPLFQVLRDQLQQMDRLSWLYEESARLLEQSICTLSADYAWKSFSGGATLNFHDQQLARQLLIWREKRAKSVNRPRQWIMSDHQIADLARNKPQTVQMTAHMLGKKRHRIPNWVSSVHAMLSAKTPNTHLPIWNSWKSLNSDQKRQVDELLDQINLFAMEIELPASLLCTRQEAVETVCGENSARMFSGWRWEIVGSKLQPWLEANDLMCVNLPKPLVSEFPK